MFIRNRKIRCLIFLACVAAMTVQPALLGAQAPTGANRSGAAARNTPTMPLRFVNADMTEFAATMSELLGLKPMMVDAAIQGSVDFSITIPRDEIFSLFNGILKTRNAALVIQNNIYQIVPISLAIKNNLEIIDERPAPGDIGPPVDVSPVQPASGQERDGERTLPVATHVIRVDFVPIEDLVTAAQLLVSDGVSIITFKRLNMMIITDYADNAARIRELVRLLDNSFMDPDLVELIKIEYSSAADVADELRKILGNGAGDAAATGPSIVPLERHNAIFVSAASRRALEEVKRLIMELDNDSGNKFQNFVYVVQDSTASNIAMMLAALYDDDGSGTGSSTRTGARNTQGSGTRSSSTLSGLSSLLGNDGYGGTFGSAQQLGPRLNTSSPSISSIILKGGAFSGLRDEARVVVDDINNVLHIQATPADYRFLLSAIERMDVSPRQVEIDVQIFEVDLTGELAYGFRGMLEGRTEGNLTTAGLTDGTDSGGGSNRLLSIETFAHVGNSRQITLAIDALRTRTNVKTLENPKLFATDGIEASFVSGADVPTPGESFITTGGSSTSMVYRETGVALYVLPKISASGSVMMDITQEVSTVSERTVAGLSAPVFPKTTVKTTLSVKDGETVAIAGLIRDSSRWGRSGIPFLSDIPILGGLFGATGRSNTRTELIVLLTPHVIRTPDKFQELTQGVRDSLRNVRKFADESDERRIRDIEDARTDREKKELDRIKEIKPSK